MITHITGMAGSYGFAYMASRYRIFTAFLAAGLGLVWHPGLLRAGPILPFETNTWLQLPLPEVSTSNINAATESALDEFHNSVHEKVQGLMESVDHWFVRKDQEPKPVPPIRMRVGLYNETDLRSGAGLSLSPKVDFSLDVHFPDIEDRLKLVVTTVDPTLLPGSEIIEPRRVLRVGLNRYWHDIDSTIGIRSGWPPDPYVQAAWSTAFSNGWWRLYPQQKVYFESEGGFGEISSLIIDRWSGQWDLRSITAIRWSQERMQSDNSVTNGNRGWQWEQNLIFGYFKELIDERDYGHLAGGNDLTRGEGVRISFIGGPASVDVMRLTLFHKEPLYHRWLYYSVNLEVEKSVDTYWYAEYRVIVGLEALFWGTQNR